MISKVALLDVLGKCVEVHEVCIKCAAATYSLRCDKCKGKYLWDLKLKFKLQSRRFVLFLAFLIDMHHDACLAGARELDLSAR